MRVRLSLLNNYYFSSFFWNTVQKLLAAVVGFISVPLLLNYYGKEQYGVLSLAIACNGYMHLLDLGMNVGTVRYFSLWRQKGDNNQINRVARTNITFYGIIAIINALLLLLIAIWGESLFSVSHRQFLQLRNCLIIIASFSIVSWGATTFNQLLVADKQISYTARVQSVLTIFKLLLIWAALYFHLSLTIYFLFFTIIVSFSIIPYIFHCLRGKLITSIRPATYWSDFKSVLTFSLSIFALSLFQMTATQTRPIVLGIFAENGAEVNAEYKILEVIPQFIIMIAGTFASVFLPQATELITKNDKKEISKFAYRWTTLTTIVTNILCFPFLLAASDILSAYVGCNYNYLSPWLMTWVLCTLINMHNSPSYALVMAYGKTKVMVFVCGIASISSVIFNASTARILGVGSAVVGYWIYVLIMLGVYYLYYYKKHFGLSRKRLFITFLFPTMLGAISFFCASIIFECFNKVQLEVLSIRMNYLFSFFIKSFIWMIIFSFLLFGLGVVRISRGKLYTFAEFK